MKNSHNVTVDAPNTPIADSKIFAVAKLIRLLDESAAIMKTQKLLYYVQGWSLAWTGYPMFVQEPQAWINGPVYPTVRKDMKYARGARIEAASIDELSEQDRAIVRAVVQKHMSDNGMSLGHQTHDESPWRNARGSCDDTERSSESISLQDMLRYFSALPLEEAPVDCSAAVGTEATPPSDSFFDRESQRWEELLVRLSA